MPKLAAALCAAALLLTACGGNEDEAKANIKTSLLEQESGVVGADPTEEQAACLSDGMVDEIGVDQLQEYGLLNDDLELDSDADPSMEEGDADALADVFMDCVDMEAMFEEQFASFTGQQELPGEAQACIEDAIDEEIIREGLSATFQGEDEVMTTEVQEKLSACITEGIGDDAEK